MKRLFNILLISLLSFSCTAQQAGERITKTTVAIINNSNSTKTILLGRQSNPGTFKIKANETWFSPTFTFNPVFNLKTKNHIVTYQLYRGNYYLIFWNGKKKYWDLKKTKKR